VVGAWQLSIRPGQRLRCPRRLPPLPPRMSYEAGLEEEDMRDTDESGDEEDNGVELSSEKPQPPALPERRRKQ